MAVKQFTGTVCMYDNMTVLYVIMDIFYRSSYKYFNNQNKAVKNLDYSK